METQVKLKFHSVDFPVVDFKSLKSMIGVETNVEINMTPKVHYPKDRNNYFNIIQEINVKSEEYFNLVVVAVGVFEIIGEVDEALKKNFINTNAPAIMFPYIRSFISTLTSNLGNVTGTLTIPPQFFDGKNLEEINEQ